MEKNKVVLIGSAKTEAVRAAVNRAEAELKALGVPHCILAIDRQPEDPEGGNVFYVQEMQGKDFINVLNVGLKTKQDVIAMGVHLARLMQNREQELIAKLKPGPVHRAMNAAKNPKKRKK